MIEVSLGYHSLDRWRELHDRVDALGPAVVEVVYRGDPPTWLRDMAQLALQRDAAVVINIKGAAPGETVAMVPFSLYERLLAAVGG